MPRIQLKQTPFLASQAPSKDGDEEYWWDGEPEKWEAMVFRTDRFGQKWALALDSGSWVTHRVAAGLLNVSVMTIHNWVRQGKFSGVKSRKSVSVIPLREIARIAEERGVFIRFPFSREQERSLKVATFKKKEGGE